MAFADARAILQYWAEAPPENEGLAILAQAFTSWKPARHQTTTTEDHQRSLEERWADGAMNPKQIFEALGGKQGQTVGLSITPDGTFRIEPTPTLNVPGVPHGQ
jgi:hypothetical protein